MAKWPKARKFADGGSTDQFAEYRARHPELADEPGLEQVDKYLIPAGIGAKYLATVLRGGSINGTPVSLAGYSSRKKDTKKKYARGGGIESRGKTKGRFV